MTASKVLLREALVGAAEQARAAGKRIVFASNRNGKAPHETNIFVADWVGN